MAKRTNAISVSTGPKYEKCQPLNTRLRSDQIIYLDELERQLMRGRRKEFRKERLTKNTILRAMVDFLKELKWDMTDVSDEDDLLKRIEKSSFRK